MTHIQLLYITCLIRQHHLMGLRSAGFVTMRARQSGSDKSFGNARNGLFLLCRHFPDRGQQLWIEREGDSFLARLSRWRSSHRGKDNSSAIKMSTKFFFLKAQRQLKGKIPQAPYRVNVR